MTAYRANEPDGPPKPPRRQQSLNRIHIPEGPDYDPTSASDSPHSGTNSPHTSRSREPAFKVSHQEPNYANYTSSGYQQQSNMTYTERTQSHSVTTARPQYGRQRSFPGNGYQDDPPTYGDVEEYRARSVMGDYASESTRQGRRARRNIDTSNRMYRSDGELNAVQSEPELENWDRMARHPLQHSDSLRTDPGRYNTGDREYRPSVKHTDSLRSAPGGYSYGNSWQDEPSWKRDPRLRYQHEQSAFHGSLVRPSRHDHVPRSKQGNYHTQQYPSTDYIVNKSSRPSDYSQNGSESNGRRSGRRSAPPVSKQGYSSDSGISSYKNPSESDPVYENTDRKHADPTYANSNGYANHPKNLGGIWERDGGGYVIDGPHEMAVDVPGEMIQQQSSAPLMASLPRPTEGSKTSQPTVPRDDIQAQPSSSTQDPKWTDHLAKRQQRREQLRSSSQESTDSGDKSDYDNQPEQRQRPQWRHTTEVPLSSEGIIQPQQADTQESGYPSDMPKRQRHGGRAPSQGDYVPNSAYHGPYNDPNAPYAPKRPYDPYNPYHYGPYGEIPPRMNFAPIHSAPGYAPYGPPLSPVDPRYGAHSPQPGGPYGAGHPYEHRPGNHSPTGAPPQRWPGPDPRYGPQGFAPDPYMPYGQSRETYSASYNMPPYMQPGGYYQPPIPSAMFYGQHYPGEAPPPQMGSPKRARSVDALDLQASSQPQLHASPGHSSSQSVSPQRSLSPDDKTKKMQELRQRVKGYLVEEKKRSKSVGAPASEEVIAPTQANVAHAAAPPSSAPNGNGMLPAGSQPIQQHETATSVGAKLFLKKKKEAVIDDLKKKIRDDRRYGSEPDLTGERETPYQSSSARPLRISSGGSGNDTADSRQSRRKAEKITEHALNELEEMYALLDKEAADLLEAGEYEPEYQRLTELKLRAKRRIEDLKMERDMEEQGLIPPSQRGKRRPRRAKSDITDNAYRSQSLTNLTHSEDERQQQFFPYRTSQHPDNLNLDDQSYKPPKDPQNMQFIKRNTQSSSEDDGSDIRMPNSSLYRRPRSEDYLGYSSDSSPSPERRMRNSKRKPVAQPRKGKDGEAVLPEYIKKSTANQDYSAPKSGYDSDKSGRSSLADRRREFFLSGAQPGPVNIDLERPLSPTKKKELAVAYTEIKLMTSTAMSNYAKTRSKSPAPRSHSPLPYPDTSTIPVTRNISPPAQGVSPKGKMVKERTVISVSSRSVEQSAPTRRPVPAPRKTLTVPSVENQPAGTRTSVSSVSTIDSTGLAQPFEEMGREYGTLIGEHYPHMADRDLSRRSSSMDSLVQTVTDVPKRVARQTVSPRAPTPPSQPPPESDVEKSGDDKKKGGIWALLGPKKGAPKTETDSGKTAPLPSPDPTLSSDSENEQFEMPHNANSTDESFQTPPLSLEPELIPEVEEPVQATAVKATELPPDLFKMPLESLDNMRHMDSESESSSSEEESSDADEDDTQLAENAFQGHNQDIPHADSSDESETEQLKTIREPLRANGDLYRGPNESAPLAYDENGK